MTTTIPQQQHAAVKEGSSHCAKAPLKLIPVPTPGPGEMLVKITWTGLCASDKSLLHDEFSAYGVTMQDSTHGVAGHEGVGHVVALGDGAAKLGWKLGDRAGIKWIADVCGTCHYCIEAYEGGEVLCLHQKNSGMSVAGTFQEYCVTSAAYATHIPDKVADEEAGPIMCGGVTAYKACRRANVRPGQWVALLGAGGGLGHLGVQYAKALGMRVIAIDAGDAKRDLCLKLGAEAYLDVLATKDLTAAVKELTDGLGAHGAIVFAAVAASYAAAPLLLRSGGTMVAIGLPADPTVVAGASPMLVALRQLNIVGSAVGNQQDVVEALDFTARGLVHPILTKGKLADVDKFIEEMMAGRLAGRAVLKVSE